MQISRAVFDEQRRPRFGTANPERMRLAFWEWVIRGGGGPAGEGGVHAAYGPWQAREVFGGARNGEDGPIWTFSRYGRTETALPGGRLVCVGGEHEDFYDPDFCIYNDVVVLGPNGAVEN